uniref:Uncharacterized protein n=1 Tax=Romanomermis culicivorax TaxID=13658 RepID=A0A915J8Y3_ROMCU
MAGYWLCGASVDADDRMDIPMGEKVGANDTLIVSIIVEDYAFDHMFTERRFHCEDYWTMGINNGSISHFDFTTYPKLELLFVESGFD